MSWLRFLVLCSVVAMIGCGPRGTSVKEVEVTAKDKVIDFLKQVAEQGGGGGSALGAIMEECNKLEETEPALAQEIKQTLQDSMSGKYTSDQLKEKAKELLAKLEGSSPPAGG